MARTDGTAARIDGKNRWQEQMARKQMGRTTSKQVHNIDISEKSAPNICISISFVSWVAYRGSLFHFIAYCKKRTEIKNFVGIVIGQR
jgi:hypothetical protein